MDVVSALYGALQVESSRLAAQAPYLMGGCKLAAAACEFMQKLHQCNAVHYVMDLVRPIFSIWDLLRHSNNIGLICTLLRAEQDVPAMGDLVRSIHLVLEWAKADGLYASDMQDKLQDGCRQFLDNFPQVTDSQHLLMESLHIACKSSLWDDENRLLSQDYITHAVNDVMDAFRHPEPLTFGDIWAEVAQIEKAAMAEQSRRRNRTLVRMEKHLMLLRSSGSVTHTAAAAVANADRIASGALSSKTSSVMGSGELPPLSGLSGLGFSSPARAQLSGRSNSMELSAGRNSSEGFGGRNGAEELSSNVELRRGGMIGAGMGPVSDGLGPHDVDLEEESNERADERGDTERLFLPPSPFFNPLLRSLAEPQDGAAAGGDSEEDDDEEIAAVAAAAAAALGQRSCNSCVNLSGNSGAAASATAAATATTVAAATAAATAAAAAARAAAAAAAAAATATSAPVQQLVLSHALEAPSTGRQLPSEPVPAPTRARNLVANVGTHTSLQGADTAGTAAAGKTAPSGAGPSTTVASAAARQAVGAGAGEGASAAKPGTMSNPFMEYSHSIAPPAVKPFTSILREDRSVTMRMPGLPPTSLSSFPSMSQGHNLDRSRSSSSSSFSRASSLNLSRSLSRSLSLSLPSQSRNLNRAVSDNRGLAGRMSSALDFSITPDGHLVTQSDKFLSKLEQPLNDFLCPISRQVMRDPVMLETGHTFDRSAIEDWFHEGNRTCPTTGRLLRRTDLTTNWALKKIIDAWVQQQPQKSPANPPAPHASFSMSVPAQLAPWRSHSKPLGSFLSNQFSNDLHLRDSYRDRSLHSAALTLRLLESATQGDVVAVKQLLGKGAPVEGMDADGLTPLHRGCATGSLEVVRVLLEAGANMGARNEAGGTPLLAAACNGRKEVAELLLKHGTSLYEYDSNHQTPLHAAAERGHTGVVEVLLRHGCPTECKDESGATPLLLAARGGHVEVVDVLLSASAMINVVDKAGYPPLYYAVFEGHVEAAERLLAAGSAVNKPIGPNRNCLLLVPAINGNTAMVELLLRFGAKAYANLASLSPLYCAASNGHERVVEVLLDAPGGREWVDVCETRSHMKLSPLLSSIKGGHNEVTYLLLKAGANMEYRVGGEQWGKTALMFAAAKGDAQAVKLLLKAGAATDAVDKDKWDALLLALEFGHMRVVEVLLDAGVNPCVCPHRCMSPLEVAALAGNLSAMQCLVEAGADVNAVSATGSRPIQAACQQGNVEMVKWLVQQGAWMDRVDEHGYLPLHDAVHSNSTAVVQLLLEHGSNIHSFTRDGETPLILASAQAEGVDMVAFLLSAGAQVQQAAQGDQHQAIHASAAENCVAVLDLLLRENADPNATDAHGSSPLHMAASWGHMEAVQLLLSRGSLPDLEDDRHWTALDMALDKGHDEVAVLLVDRGSNVRRQAWSSLEFAVRLNRLQVLEFMLAKDPSLASGPGPHSASHPIHLAAENELHEMVELLVKYGASKEAKDANGLTPLLVAAKSGSTQVVRSLLAVGVDLSAVDSAGCNALHLAAASSTMGASLVNTLLHARPELAGAANKQDALPLHTAAAMGKADVIRVMLKCNSVVQHLNSLAPLDSQMLSPLAFACYNGHEAAARALLNGGADVGGSGGALPMVLAVGQGHHGVVQLLQRNMKLTKSYILRHQQLPGAAGAGVAEEGEDAEEQMLGSDSKILSAIDEELERELG